MCGRYVVTNAVSKTKGIVKAAINVKDNENYNAHPYQDLPVIKKYTNGYTLENLKPRQKLAYNVIKNNFEK